MNLLVRAEAYLGGLLVGGSDKFIDVTASPKHGHELEPFNIGAGHTPVVDEGGLGLAVGGQKAGVHGPGVTELRELADIDMVVRSTRVVRGGI